MAFFKNFFGRKAIGDLEALVTEIGALEAEIQALSSEDMLRESQTLRERLQGSEEIDTVLPRAFALAREAAKRTLNQRPYDVQLLGGLALHRGSVAEMATGEGKTLSAVAPAYLNALKGEGVHVVTVNEYLARRDAVWMGQIYRALGLSVACLVPNAAFLYDPEWKIPKDGQALIDEERDTTGSFLVQQEFLRPITRREAYLADITYGTNHEFGFDLLRDNLAYSVVQQVQRGHAFAIIDEVDSILIDEARTPLIISAPDAASSELYQTFTRVAANLKPEEDYVVDEKMRSVLINDSGIEKVEKVMGVQNIYSAENLRMVHFLEESLKAKALFHRDKEYVVREGQIIIVDEFTGRMLAGRRYNGGLHQAIEAKEGVKIQEESRVYGKVSIQNYFRLYKKIAGMTGTGQTSAEEFHKVYGLEVITIPTNRPNVRIDAADLIYKNAGAKWRAVVAEIKARQEKGQPVLVGTTSITKNELLSSMLSAANVPHQVLNAKRNEEEGKTIAQAGRQGRVTVATNIAGRGVDIILGGNPPDPKEAEKVRELGGLYVLGTERHEARRIDNQLRGRAGRQGDPGHSQFFLSLEDDLMRIFGGDRLKGLMERFDLPEDQPIQMGMVSSAVAQAQAKVEGNNFDVRKHLLEYDDVLNKQRTAVYKRRQDILTAMNHPALADMIFNAVYAYMEVLWQESMDPRQDFEAAKENLEKLKKFLTESAIFNEKNPLPEDLSSPEEIKDILTKRSMEAAMDPGTLQKTLGILDLLWMNHLEDLEALNESVGLRAYGQKDPLVEYREESRRLFDKFWDNFNGWMFSNIFKGVGQAQGGTSGAIAASGSTGTQPVVMSSPIQLPNASAPILTGDDKIGRNDPCPCGSGKKYKKCGLLNTEEHQKLMQSR